MERRVLVRESLSLGEMKVGRERLRMGFRVRVFVVLGMCLERSEAVVCCRDAIVGVERRKEEEEESSVTVVSEMK